MNYHGHITNHENYPEILLYKYGHNFISASSFSASILALQETDRAGAAAQAVVTDIVEQLRVRFRTSYVSEHVNWQIWGSWISRKPVPQQASLILEPPPPQRQSTLTRSIIDDLDRELKVVKAIVKNSLQTMQDGLLRIEAIEQGLAGHRQTTTAIDAALNPLETADSREIFESIPNQVDIDHAE